MALDLDASLSPADKERLLDRFPLTETELSQLWPLTTQEASCYWRDASLPRLSNHTFLQQGLAALWQTTLDNVFLLSFAENDALYGIAQHLETAAVLLGRRGEAALITALWQGATTATNSGKTDPPTRTQIVLWIHSLLQAVHGVTSSTTRLVQTAWEASLPADAVSLPLFRQWISDVAPFLPIVLSTLMHILLFHESMDRLSLPWPTTSEYPVLGSSFAPLWAMLGGDATCVHPLYNSTDHGLSFTTLSAHLLTYHGPTLLLVRTTEHQDLWGYYTQVPWKQSSPGTRHQKSDKNNAPSLDAFLFSLEPIWRRYNLTGDNAIPSPSWLQMLSSRTGLSIGGISADTPRVHITPTLEDCQATAVGRLFRNGPLLGQDIDTGLDRLTFGVDEVRVYALSASQEALQQGLARGQQTVVAATALRQRLAHVDKRQFVDDLTFLPNNHLFAHREQTRGRAEFVANEEESKGYYVDSKPPSSVSPINRKKEALT